MDRDEVEVHKNAKKQGQYPAILTERNVQKVTPSISFNALANVSADQSVRSEHRIRFILLARGGSHIKTLSIYIYIKIINLKVKTEINGSFHL